MNEQQAYGNNGIGNKQLTDLAEELGNKHGVVHGRAYDLLIHAEVRLFMNNPRTYFMHKPLLKADAHTLIDKYLGINKIRYDKYNRIHA